MPTLRITPDLEMNYLADDYTDPWRNPETILMLHGNAESGSAWFGWVPHLARHFHVVRPDMRGFGSSTPMPRDFPWTIEILIDDYIRLMDTLGVERFHLVGAKIGGTVARCFAARHPERVRTLTVVGSPGPQAQAAGRTQYPGERVSDRVNELETQGVGSWAHRTMSGRLGSRFPPDGVDWWIKLMARTPLSTEIGFVSTLVNWDISSYLPRIMCPTLVIEAEGSGLRSVEKTRAWQQIIPRSKLLVLPGDSNHVAASDADRCAQETFDFISHIGATAI